MSSNVGLKNIDKGELSFMKINKEISNSELTEPVVVDAAQERVLLALHNAMYRINHELVGIGDVVLTDQHFYFIQHGGFRYRGEIAQFAAFMVGGPLLALGTAMLDGDPKNAKVWADGERNKLYGLSPRERANRCDGSVVIAVAEISRLTGSNAQSTTVGYETRTGQSHAYAVPPLSDELASALAKWPHTEPIYDQAHDPDGFSGATSILPEEFLKQTLGGGASLGPFLTNATGDANYLGMVYDKLVRLKEPERQAVINVWLNFPESFRDAFGMVLKKRVKSLMGMILYFGWVPILFVVISLNLIPEAIREKSVLWFFLSLVFAALGLLFGSLTWEFIEERRFARRAGTQLLKNK